jgi:hypothetical protein
VGVHTRDKWRVRLNGLPQADYHLDPGRGAGLVYPCACYSVILPLLLALHRYISCFVPYYLGALEGDANCLLLIALHRVFPIQELPPEEEDVCPVCFGGMAPNEKTFYRKQRTRYISNAVT